MAQGQFDAELVYRFLLRNKKSTDLSWLEMMDYKTVTHCPFFLELRLKLETLYETKILIMYIFLS